MADLHLTAGLLLLGLEGAALFSNRRDASADHHPTPPWTFIAAAALCAWSKDEGIAVASTAGLVLAWAIIRARVPLRSGGLGIAVLALLAWSWRMFVGWHDLEFPATLAWPVGGVTELLDRVPVILSHFAQLPLNYAPSGTSPWGVLWPVTAGALVFGLVFTRVLSDTAVPAAARRAWRAPLILLFAHIGLYVGVYALNTQPLEWVLGNSAPRVFMHLLPWLLLLLAGALAPCGGRDSTRSRSASR
jgi:hypothetical protein